jgi:hypothetical protein
MRGGQNSERNCRASPALFGGRPAINRAIGGELPRVQWIGPVDREGGQLRHARRGEHVIDRRPHDALNTRGGPSGSMPTPR